MKYRIIEEWTTSQKVRYIPQFKSGWWIFKSWSNFVDYRIWDEQNLFPPFGWDIPLKCDSFTEAEETINKHKVQNEEVKRNFIILS